jgi:uncharacterized membrane protein YqiK
MQWLGMDDPDWKKMMLTMIAIVIGIVLLISLILALRYRPPKRDRAAILYKKFVKKVGVDPHTGETPAIFAARLDGNTEVQAEAIEDVTSAYLLARYGAPDPSSLQRLESAVSRL